MVPDTDSDGNRLPPGGFARIPNWVIEQIRNDGDFRTFAALCAHCWIDDTCFPSRETLAEICGCSVDTIDRRTKRLDGKFIKVIKGGGRGKETTYQVTGLNSRTSAAVSEDEQPHIRGETAANLPDSAAPDITSRKRQGMNNTPIPPSLDNHEFREAWQDYRQHRNEIRKPMTPTSTARLLSKLEKWGATKAIRAINLSIENGWRGIFDPEQKERSNGDQPSRSGQRGRRPSGHTSDSPARIRGQGR